MVENRQISDVAELEKIIAMAQNNPKKVTIEAIVLVLRTLPEHYQKTQKEVCLSAHGAPNWAQYEVSIWQLSEGIRGYLKGYRNIRGKSEVLDAIEELVSKKQFGKGRQNFVIILGQYGGGSYAAMLGKLLDDPDVYGHAISAITKAKIRGYLEKVKLILSESKVGWIRAAARKYINATWQTD